MLAHRTVIVLGAGASVPYGFLSGAQLLEKARRSNVDNLYEQIGQKPSKTAIRDFLGVVSVSQNSSLDALLEFRPPEEQNAGKRLMASELLACEQGALVMPPVTSGDWIGYLFERLTDRQPSCAKLFDSLSLTFVTYNYDRLIEHRLLRALLAKYPKERELILARFSSILPVIHLHGSLGSLSDQNPHYVPFGMREESILTHGEGANWMFLDRAAQSIRIVHEPDSASEEFMKARVALSIAERVVILGFAFSPTNVDRLDLSCIASGASVFYTTKGLTAAEVGFQIDTPFSRCQGLSRFPGGIAVDALQHLRDNVGHLFRRY